MDKLGAISESFREGSGLGPVFKWFLILIVVVFVYYIWTEIKDVLNEKKKK